MINTTSNVVKINSKYKEDDFSDSNAVAFSLDVCVLKIHFLHVVPTCQTPLLLPPPSTDPSPGSQRRTLEMITTSSQGAMLAPS